ncbi:MAG: methylated-DNA--[protein]-cysteine S-methyltransferase [Clostridia bacterium]|nr:methylated-DNA--[protein]-cysteine S-methyltransferase [Clostridia bacterium]
MIGCRYVSPLGTILLAADDTGLTALCFEGQKHVEKAYPEVTIGTSPILERAAEWLDDYFAGKCPNTDGIPLNPSGTDFQKAVWKRLQAIPYGSTVTYGALSAQVAVDLGKESMSARAVGHAVGMNPISLLLPCHRVIGADGSLTGYAGGIDRKIALLKLEGALK